MNLYTFKGKVVSQPVVVPLQGYDVVFVVIEVDSTIIRGRKKFFCQTGNYKSNNGRDLATTIFSDVVCSSIGDEVRFKAEVNQKTKEIDAEIKYFANETLGIGNI